MMSESFILISELFKHTDSFSNKTNDNPFLSENLLLNQFFQKHRLIQELNK